MSLVLDEQKEDDMIEVVDGITFIVAKEIGTYLNDLTVLFMRGLLKDAFVVKASGANGCG